MGLKHSTTVTDNVDTVNASKWNSDHLTTTPYEITIGSATYIIYQEGGSVYARNGKTGVNDFGPTSPSSAHTLLQAVLDSAAMVGGGSVYVKKGTYTIGAAVSSIIDNIEIRGEPGTIFSTASGFNGDMLTFSGKYTSLEGFRCKTATSNTGGYALKLTGDFPTVRNVVIGDLAVAATQFYNGIYATGAEVTFDNLKFYNISNFGITIENTQGQNYYFSNISHNSNNAPNNIALNILGIGGLQITNLQIYKGSYGLYCVPATGATVLAFFMRNVAFDTLTNDGIHIDGTNLANAIPYVYISGIWAQVNNRGVFMKKVGAWEIESGVIQSNFAEGIYVDANCDLWIVRNLELLSNNLNNIAAIANIRVGSGNFHILGNEMGNPYGIGHAKYNIDLQAGAGIIAHNNMPAGETGNINFAAGFSGFLVDHNKGFASPVSQIGLAHATIKAGAPTDADFTAPVDGLIVVDTTNNKIWARVGGVWKGVTIA